MEQRNASVLARSQFRTSQRHLEKSRFVRWPKRNEASQNRGY